MVYLGEMKVCPGCGVVVHHDIRMCPVCDKFFDTLDSRDSIIKR
jgi:RNA polymerase subunit RPABC4/transcription elongation factor Spt4